MNVAPYKASATSPGGPSWVSGLGLEMFLFSALIRTDSGLFLRTIMVLTVVPFQDGCTAKANHRIEKEGS